VSNRLVQTDTNFPTGPGSYFYTYAPGNKRVWKGGGSSIFNGVFNGEDEFTFYSITGQKMVSFNRTSGGTGTAFLYFGGKMIKNSTGYITPDNRGSNGKFFPYGQERPSATTNDKEKFATYYRDAETGLDYAQNRYHSSGDGRFTTPDPSHAANPKDPGSWN